MLENQKQKNIIIVNPLINGEEKLQELLRMFFNEYAGFTTLYIIDDCSATKELTKKRDMLSELAFSGRHAEQSVMGYIAKIQFSFERFKRTNKMVMYVLHKR